MDLIEVEVRNSSLKTFRINLNNELFLRKPHNNIEQGYCITTITKKFREHKVFLNILFIYPKLKVGHNVLTYKTNTVYISNCSTTRYIYPIVPIVQRRRLRTQNNHVTTTKCSKSKIIVPRRSLGPQNNHVTITICSKSRKI